MPHVANRELMVVNAYGFLKFLHVLSVVVWVGGVTGLSVVAWRLGRERNREVLPALLRQATSFGQKIAGPASFIVPQTHSLDYTRGGDSGMSPISSRNRWPPVVFSPLVSTRVITSRALVRVIPT